MNNPIFKAVTLVVFLMLGFFVGSKVIASDHPKPESVVEFGISKHAGLHYVNGGFDVETVSVKSEDSKGFHHVKAKVAISSLWTWQADASKHDDPRRTNDLLSDDWFDANKFPYAFAEIHHLPFEGDGEVKLTIKGITKQIKFRSSHGKIKLRIILKDFNLAPSWKRIFAGNFADVTIRIKK